MTPRNRSTITGPFPLGRLHHPKTWPPRPTPPDAANEIRYKGRSGTASISLTVTTPALSLAIHDIQGSGDTSPFVAALVSTTGIVTGVRSNGFFMQAPDAAADSDPNTSEGIFVFTSSAPPSAAVAGNLVAVTGTVSEFIPSTDPNSPSFTEIVSPAVTLLSTWNALPAPVTLTTAD